MQFTKMHGAGNDYVYINCFPGTESYEPVLDYPDRLPELAIAIADRHFGVGGDGLVLICPPENAGNADARMRMFNADGSESEMCGNAIRCVGKYLYDHAICRKETLRVETGAGLRIIELTILDGKAIKARVDMGEPILDPQKIPTTLSTNLNGQVVNSPLEVAGRTLNATCVSMGNPHCVTFVEQIKFEGEANSDEWVLGLGPKVENHTAFPKRINAEFVEVVSPTELNMRVWERGSGETWACGTGACAVCVAGVLTGRSERKVLIHLRGGDLEIEWDAASNHVFMTGPAVEVFAGQWWA